MSARDRILSSFQKALQKMEQRGRDELTAQGHVASGRGIASLEGRITNDNLNNLIGVILGEDYLIPLDTGVPAGNVPYSRSGGGGRSAYITGLLRWADQIKPTLSEREKRSFVFAVANRAKQTGHPTPGAFRFSKNGRRTKWIETAFASDEAQDEFEKALDAAAVIAEEFLNSL